MKNGLENWEILVTGGAVRVGRAICEAFAEHGARVIVHCHHSIRAANLLVEKLPLAANGKEHSVVRGDLTDRDFRAGLIPGLNQRGIRLNCLINNASTYRRSPLQSLSETAIREDFDINFFAPFMLMKDFAEHCGSGCVINLLDQRITLVEKNTGAYGLAKKALRDATEAAALEWAPAIRVNAVAPGYSLPPPGGSEENMRPLINNIPMRQASPPAHIAAACLFLATSETVTGQVLFVDGGMHLTSPGREETWRSVTPGNR
ncbi:MAG: SDR family oxidoreductase [Lentisphaeria bacterium]|nr:SDR family oxidoreductase [Lentisphaeria bacterium]